MTSEVYVGHAVLLRPRLASIELCYFLTPWPLAFLGGRNWAMTRQECDESAQHALSCTAVCIVWFCRTWRVAVCLQPVSPAECSCRMQDLPLLSSGAVCAGLSLMWPSHLRSA